MRFANPKMLWLLGAALPLLVWFLWWAWRKKQSLIAQFVQSRLLAQLTVGVAPRRQKVRLGLLVAAVALILLALARPQYGFAWEEVKQRGLDIVVAIDTSRSMLATDVAPSRLARAKLAALDLMRAARSDRFGLIAFAGTAFLQCPLTVDDEAFRQSVNSLEVGIIPQGGTAIAEAIETALSAFKVGEDNFKAMVLFTDGEDQEGGALEAADKAAKAGLRIFTVGIGTPEGERLRATDEHGKTSYVRDDDGSEVTSKLNEDLLRKVAQKTHGDYLLLRGARPMELLYEARLAPLPRGELGSHLFQLFYDRFQWPLSLAIALLILEMFLPERKRVVRSPALVNAPNPGVRQLVTLFLVLALSVSALGSPAKALRAYEAGRLREAQSEYERLLQKQPEDPRLHYNAGTAAYGTGRFEQATNELSAATLSSDPELLKRVYYNLGNTLFRLGERAGEPAAQIEDWEQSLRHYDSALKLAPEDADAKFNRELVAKRLEELKKQQQEQQQSDNQDKKDQDKQDQDKKDQSQKSDPKQKQDQKDQAKSQEKDKPPQDPQSKQDPKQDKPQPPQPKPEDKKQDQAKKGDKDAEQKKADQSKDKPEDQGQDAPPAVLGQMTPEQARQLLEAAKAEEKPMIFVLPKDPKRRERILKDW